MGACHDDSKLDLYAELEEPNQPSGNRLVGLGVDWVRSIEGSKRSMGRLNRKGISTAGGKDLHDSMVHGTSHGSGVFVVTIHLCLD